MTVMSGSTNIPAPDGTAFVWVLVRPGNEQDAWAAIGTAREGESFYRYRAWCVMSLGRRPVFDAQDHRTFRVRACMLPTLPVPPANQDRIAAMMLDTARLFQAIAAAYLFWDDDGWSLAAALLGAGWSGSDRELVESVSAATS